MRKHKLVCLVFAVTLLVLGFASTSSATHSCVLLYNWCNSCAPNKIQSCDRWRCVDDTSGSYVYFNECTPCSNYC